MNIKALTCLIWLAIPSAIALAQVSECEPLKGPAKATALAILERLHPYDCCDETIAACLKQHPTCRLAKRLAAAVCRRVLAGQDRTAIEHALERRADSMMRIGKPFGIALQNEPAAGQADAKVTLVTYVCTRCPFCAQLTPKLYHAVTEGKLKGKARLYAKLFPLRNHPGSTEGGMAAMAAGRLGRFWPFLLHLYRNFDHFKVEKLPDCAAAAGLDRAAFQPLLSDAKLRSRLVESKKEGIRNGVDATPMLFIDGFRYTGEPTIEAIVDVVEEEFDRVSGKIRD
jgi:2-hydroxychromene-2-carboxylate isomerase